MVVVLVRWPAVPRGFQILSAVYPVYRLLLLTRGVVPSGATFDYCSVIVNLLRLWWDCKLVK